MSAPRTRTFAAAVLTTAALVGCGASSPAPAPTSAGLSTTAPSTVSGTSTSAPLNAVSSPAPVGTESNPPGDIPDNQAYVVVSPPGATVSVKVPEGWARSSTSSTTTLSDKLNRIQIITATTPSAPTVSSVTRTDIPTLPADVPKFAMGKVSSVRRAAGPAVLVSYQGDSPVDPVTGKVVRDAFERYIFYRGGTRVDVVLSAPVNADNVDPWRIVTDSLRWTR